MSLRGGMPNSHEQRIAYRRPRARQSLGKLQQRRAYFLTRSWIFSGLRFTGSPELPLHSLVESQPPLSTTRFGERLNRFGVRARSRPPSEFSDTRETGLAEMGRGRR